MIRLPYFHSDTCVFGVKSSETDREMERGQASIGPYLSKKKQGSEEAKTDRSRKTRAQVGHKRAEYEAGDIGLLLVFPYLGERFH